MASNGVPRAGSALTGAISAAAAEPYAEFYNHERTTATTYEKLRKQMGVPA